MRHCRICELPIKSKPVTLPMFDPKADAARDDIWAHRHCLLDPPRELRARRDEVCAWSMRESMDGGLHE